MGYDHLLYDLLSGPYIALFFLVVFLVYGLIEYLARWATPPRFTTPKRWTILRFVIAASVAILVLTVPPIGMIVVVSAPLLLVARFMARYKIVRRYPK